MSPEKCQHLALNWWILTGNQWAPNLSEVDLRTHFNGPNDFEPDSSTWCNHSGCVPPKMEHPPVNQLWHLSHSPLLEVDTPLEVPARERFQRRGCAKRWLPGRVKEAPLDS